MILYKLCALICFFAFVPRAFAAGKIWSDPPCREWVSGQLDIIKQEAQNTLNDLDEVLRGQNVELEETLVKLLHDDDKRTKIRRVRHHLSSLYDLVSQGISTSPTPTWFLMEAKDGVTFVCSDQFFTTTAEHHEIWELITGVYHEKSDNHIRNILSPESSSDEMSTIRHIWRPDTYPNRGEWITINLHKLDVWEEEAEEGNADRQADLSFWARLSDREWWDRLPADTKYVPMDLALAEPYLTITHELMHCVPCNSLQHSSEHVSGGWEAIKHEIPDFPLEDHPEMIAAVIAICRAYRYSIRLDTDTGNFHDMI